MRLRKKQDDQPLGDVPLQEEPVPAPEEWAPTWAERQGYGRDIPVEDVARVVVDWGLSTEQGVNWRLIHFMATMHAENNGFMEWARPMVWRPDDPRVHQTTDRGICALNSYWYQTAYPPGHLQNVPDTVAYDWEDALFTTMTIIQEYAIQKVKGSSVWDWKPILDWQWHAYGTDRYTKQIPIMREAINAELALMGIDPI